MVRIWHKLDPLLGGTFSAGSQGSLGHFCRVGPGNFTPSPSQIPDLTLSRHPARATARRLPPSIEHRVPPVAG
jgi:hypothetical protein